MITCTRANEGGTLAVTVTFTDETGTEQAISALTSARWQLSDKDGNVINSRSFANGLFTANPVILSGDDLAVGTNGTVRYFAVSIVYNSTSGTGLTANDEYKFTVQNLVNIG